MWLCQNHFVSNIYDVFLFISTNFILITYTCVCLNFSQQVAQKHTHTHTCMDKSTSFDIFTPF